MLNGRTDAVAIVGGIYMTPPPPEILAKPIKKHLYPEGFFKWPVHLHHDHVNGQTIGAVHNYCNAVLWEYHGQ